MTLGMYLICGLCVAFGAILSNLYRYLHSASGTLKIDRTNPITDLYRLELDDLSDLDTKRQLVLRIESSEDLSQE